jgi:predicted GNAT superfamily acetyltransferase
VSGYALRDLNGIAEMNAAENLQRAVWGKGDTPDPADLMMVIQQEGGLVAGAFLDGRLMGYVFGFPTREPSVQHSHRLAVHPDARGAGLALRLKWFQRDWCLARDINLVRWTYDPLRVVNANINIHRLGGVSSTYLQDYYGAMSGINEGAPSDRLLVEWHLGSPSVSVRSSDTSWTAASQPGSVRIGIPADFESLLKTDRAKAMSERLRVRELMLAHFSSGYAVRDFDPASREYILVPKGASGLQSND